MWNGFTWELCTSTSVYIQLVQFCLKCTRIEISPLLKDMGFICSSGWSVSQYFSKDGVERTHFSQMFKTHKLLQCLWPFLAREERSKWVSQWGNHRRLQLLEAPRAGGNLTKAHRQNSDSLRPQQATLPGKRGKKKIMQEELRLLL